MTRQITEKELKELGYEYICDGYKALNYDNTAYAGFAFGTDGENLEGKIYEVDGELSLCKNGLHFCRDAADVHQWYASLGYNRYYRVKAYGEVKDDNDEKKSVARAILFERQMTLWEVLDVTVYATRANGVSESNGVSWSKGVSESKGVENSYGLTNCRAVFSSAFCVSKNGIAHYLFNRKSTKARCEKVISKLNGFGWYPKYTNIEALFAEAGNAESTCFPKLKTHTEAEAWADMPKDMLDYIRSLPEFDAKVFERITGIKTEAQIR